MLHLGRQIWSKMHKRTLKRQQQVTKKISRSFWRSTRIKNWEPLRIFSKQRSHADSRSTVNDKRKLHRKYHTFHIARIRVLWRYQNLKALTVIALFSLYVWHMCRLINMFIVFIYPASELTTPANTNIKHKIIS